MKLRPERAKVQINVLTSALTGRIILAIPTQGVALGYEIAGLSARFTKSETSDTYILHHKDTTYALTHPTISEYSAHGQLLFSYKDIVVRQSDSTNIV